MTNVQLTRVLERGEIANENFHHASHLHVAWIYLSESSSADEVAGKVRNTLRRFATSAGKREKYHETIMLFWVHFLSRARATQLNANAWRKSFTRIRACWKRIFHSPIIRESGFSAIEPGLLGLSPI